MVRIVGFDATSAVHQSAGIGRYIRHLLAALANLDDDTRFKLLYWARGSLHGQLPPLNNRFRVRGFPVSDRVVNAVWHRLRLPIPAQVAIGRFDLFHSPDFTLPPTYGRPGIVTIHDLAFLRTPECAVPTLRRYLEVVVPRSARRATRIIAVSENTRNDCIELLGVEPERISTVHEGVPESFTPTDPVTAASLVQSSGVHEPYILAVGTLEPRKNYERLLQAFALLRTRGAVRRLVLAGRPGWLYEPIFERMQALGLESHVTVVQPDDALLRALYTTAQAFIFPSLYEGFGIPLLEAMACGTPIACSNSSSFPEVVGSCAVLFDPRSVDDMADAIGRLLGDRALQSELRRSGLERVRRFTWHRAALKTLDVYGEALGA